MKSRNAFASGFGFWFGMLMLPVVSAAHPMGNFSINHYSRVQIGKQAVEITYLIDRAEIPTYQEIRQFGLVPQDSDPSVQPYLKSESMLLAQSLTLECDGLPVKLAVASRKAEFVAGAGGLPTLKIRLVLRGNFGKPDEDHTLSFTDGNFPGRAGWKELIVVASEGVHIRQSSAPDTDRSSQLSVYSSDLLNSPPQQLSAVASFTTPALASTKSGPGSGHPARRAVVAQAAPAKPAPKTITASSAAPKHPVAIETTPRNNTPRSRFTELITTRDNLGFWLLLSAALVAAGLGALHALEPGHGKTIVAAYLVGSRGTARHAVMLGIVVTIAHTAGVFLLGAVTLYASRYIVPEQLYPWLGAISGLSVVGLGCFIFLRHLTGASGEHSHNPAEGHSHWFFSLFQRKQQNSKDDSTATGTVSLRQLLALGITGGIVPCPAALVVLLSAFSLHRIVFGFFLITAFSAGLAAVLVAVGLVMVYTKRFVGSYLSSGSAVTRYLPLVSSGFMVLIGAGITYSAFASIPLSQTAVSKNALMPFISVVLLGLFLGMRHSTDSDHVVAVSTLVSRQGSMGGSAMVGLLWGLGHTITIFLVGSAIIVFGFVIPPRLGLSMEFAVALMLILLGILNLTGKLRRITERFSPPPEPSEMPAATSGRTKLGFFQTVRPLFVGLVHGLAGSAAVALLVLSTIRSPFWASAYLLVFGVGTMAGMMLMTSAISLPLIYAKTRFRNFTARLTLFSGLASVAFGLFLVIQIGFVDGLFTAHVHWTAH